MIVISGPATSIQRPAWCQSTALTDMLNENKGHGMRRQQQLLSGKHNYGPQVFEVSEVSIIADFRGSPHLTGKR